MKTSQLKMVTSFSSCFEERAWEPDQPELECRKPEATACLWLTFSEIEVHDGGTVILRFIMLGTVTLLCNVSSNVSARLTTQEEREKKVRGARKEEKEEGREGGRKRRRKGEKEEGREGGRERRRRGREGGRKRKREGEKEEGREGGRKRRRKEEKEEERGGRERRREQKSNSSIIPGHSQILSRSRGDFSLLRYKIWEWPGD